MIVAATDGDGIRNINVPDTLVNLLPTLLNWQEDVPNEKDEAHRIPVQAETLDWILAVAAQTSPPQEWSVRKRIDMCSGDYPEAFRSALDRLSSESLRKLVKDLDFLGGGLFYDHACRFVAIKIEESHWSIDQIQEWFGVADSQVEIDSE